MSENYKPETFVAATVDDRHDVRLFRTGDYWTDANDALIYDCDVTNVRPLVVLDPESDEHLAALCKALVYQMWHAGDEASAANGVHPATVAAALRSLNRPPKPSEPTGLGAVVEDADGSLLVRIIDDLKPWTCYGGPRWSWDDVDAVRVLSEGVEVDR